ncbi:MAG: hypothetical protein JJE03_00735 [Peptostreptococcaceae bacterium]|nr:hypothetical protein [Peptostreptococcaceae bacterium]
MAKVIIPNQEFIELLKDKSQTVIIDANLIIPPDRSDLDLKNSASLNIPFEKYKDAFIEPLLSVFSNVAIHEAVYREISETEIIKKYIDIKITSGEIILLKDDDLTPNEKSIRNTIEEKISQFTNFNPHMDNRNDRGEVKSISYAVAKKLIYFSTNDSNAISLINRTELNPFLHSLGAIKVYELIYAIRVFHKNSNLLKGIYKLLYYLTTNEKKVNSDWGTFFNECEKEYSKYCE